LLKRTFNLIQTLKKRGYTLPEERDMRPDLKQISTKRFEHVYIKTMPVFSKYRGAIVMVCFDDPQQNKVSIYSLERDDFY